MIIIWPLQKARNVLGKEGKVFYEKHKIFLYKEDFEKFSEGLKDAVAYIGNGKDELKASEPASVPDIKDEKSSLVAEEFTNVEFWRPRQEVKRFI